MSRSLTKRYGSGFCIYALDRVVFEDCTGTIKNYYTWSFRINSIPRGVSQVRKAALEQIKIRGREAIEGQYA